MFTNFQNIIQFSQYCHYQITIVAYNPHVINNNFQSYNHTYLVGNGAMYYHV